MAEWNHAIKRALLAVTGLVLADGEVGKALVPKIEPRVGREAVTGCLGNRW